MCLTKRCGIFLALVVALSAPASAQTTYFDSFEGTAINPFWTVDGGSAQLISSVSHGGTQSIQMSTSGYGETAALRHQFSGAAYGTIQVYVYDPLITGTGYKQLWATAGSNPLNSYDIYLDWGTLETYMYYPVVDPVTHAISWGNALLLPRQSTPGWRLWTITSTAAGVTVQIDGVTVFTRTVPFPFDAVQLSECCIAGTATFDDFNVTHEVPTPSPTSYADTFEAPAINPFWTVAGGSAQLVTYASHQGSQAIQMSTSGYGETAALRHEFGAASFGTVEVFVYDPGVAGTGYKQLWAMSGSDALNSYDIYLDWGTLETYLYYPVVDPLTGNVSWGNALLLPQQAAPGWRRWTINSTPAGVTVQIDGVTVFTRTVPFQFDAVQLSECCIAGTALFDDFTVTLSDSANAAPTANAGLNQTVRPGTTVFLDGSASFDDNTPTNSLGYSWSFVSVPPGSSAILSQPTSIAPSFTPDVAGNYTIQFVVTDQQGLSSAPSQVLVGENPPPVANAGLDQLVLVGSTVSLTGTGTDADNDPLTYGWAFTAVPVGSTANLTNPSQPTSSFVADAPGIYLVQLTVSDMFGPGAPDSVQITAATAADYAELHLQAAASAIAALPPASVTNGGNQNALGQLLSNAVSALQHGDAQQARQQLQNAIARTDGCAVRGAPDGNGASRDWITSCDAQAPIYEQLKAALDAIMR